MLLRYVENNFTTAFYNTIGVDFVFYTFNPENEKHRHRRQESPYASGRDLIIFSGTLQDRTGSEPSPPPTTSNPMLIVRGAHGIILVYDVTDRESFDSMRFWLQEIDKYSSSYSGTPVKMSTNL